MIYTYADLKYTDSFQVIKNRCVTFNFIYKTINRAINLDIYARFFQTAIPLLNITMASENFK